MLNQNWMLIHNISLAFGGMSSLALGFMALSSSWLVWPVAAVTCGCFLVSEVAGKKA